MKVLHKAPSYASPCGKRHGAFCSEPKPGYRRCRKCWPCKSSWDRAIIVRMLIGGKGFRAYEVGRDGRTELIKR